MDASEGDPDAERNPPEDAFGVLSHDLRLEVLRVLADAREPTSFAADPLPYSELAERVDTADSGNFNYHLRTLRDGGFIERVRGGYRIRQAGVRIVRAIQAGTITDTEGFGRTEIDAACPYCDGQSAITLEDDWLFIVCLECDGAFAQEAALPDGTLAGFEVTPAGVQDRSPTDAFRMAYTLGERVHRLFAAGVCPDCGGTTTTDVLELCLEHDVGGTGTCGACGRTTDEYLVASCDVCGRSLMTFPAIVVAIDPQVIAVTYERGRDVTDGTWTVLSKPPDWPARYVRTDPTVIEYTIPVPDGEDVRARLDEELNVTVTNP